MKGIFFDAAGILYERHEPTSRFAQRLLAQRGNSGELSEGDRLRLDALKTHAFDGHMSAQGYWDEFLRLHGVATPAERSHLVTRILDQSHQVFALPGARPTLATLKERGFLLAIITDTLYSLEWKLQWLAKAGVADLVDAVSCSTVVGAHKPDPAIYLDALGQVRLNAAEGAFVGHDGAELSGAHNVGMTTVAVNCDSHIKADYYVESLPDLLTLSIFRGERPTGAVPT